ncbi:SUMF1/EgtB/PvdO family nonheme iron enzyme [Epilithonimonas hominis]|nr:SUMF1/EgtB/PvdO family nonheme iron enzyme [Epilithonimonas hominis]
MKTNNYFKKIAIAAMGLFAFNIQANNLKITGTSVDTSAGTVTFNIQWDNSWRTNIAPANYDAVWVFLKYQDCADKLWKHANLSVTSADHSTASPLKIDAVTDGKGVFVYRSANGGGNISSTSVTLKMNVAAANYDNYNFKVFGVEMVNVPQGSFWVGDTTSSGYGVSSSTPAYNFQITSENSNIAASSLGTGNSAPSSFPKGFKSFYCMKYEITQEQYVEFLNTLTYNQQARRSVAAPNSAAGTFAFGNAYGNGIKIQVPGNNASIAALYGCDVTTGDYNDVNDGQNVAMNQLSWADTAAFLEWSALRPMTELEFEKICRGPLSPVAGEYAWRTTEINIASSTGITNAYTASEGFNTVANGRANYYAATAWTNAGTGRTVKVGFSATNSSGRATAAAAYYGAMEMSGNTYEFAVTTKATGNTYTGLAGDGELSTTTATDGDANQASWPDNTGVYLRGGDFIGAANYNGNNSSFLRISDRASGAALATRNAGYGGRGVR